MNSPSEHLTAGSRLILLLAGLCGAGVLLFATAPGIGLSPDSAAYIGAARGLLAGLGLGTPAPDGGYRPLLFYAPALPNPFRRNWRLRHRSAGCGAPAAVALNGPAYCVVINIGFWGQGLSALRQDFQATLLPAALTALLRVGRALAGIPFHV